MLEAVVVVALVLTGLGTLLLYADPGSVLAMACCLAVMTLLADLGERLAAGASATSRTPVARDYRR